MRPELVFGNAHMILNGIRFQDGGVVLDGYPAGSTAHGIEGEHAHELRRLAVFMSDLRQAQECLALIPVGPPEQSSAPLVLCEALADAALLAFCRCFDKDHPLKPLEPAQVLALTQRSETERLRLVRNKVVAHDDRLFRGVFSLVVQNSDKICIEAVSMNLRTRSTRSRSSSVRFSRITNSSRAVIPSRAWSWIRPIFGVRARCRRAAICCICARRTSKRVGSRTLLQHLSHVRRHRWRRC